MGDPVGGNPSLPPGRREKRENSKTIWTEVSTT